MPFGGLLTAGISAGGSLLGGIFGGKGAKKSADVLSNAATGVAQQDKQAAADAGQGLKNAASEAATGVQGAAGGAAATVQGAAGNANDLLAKIFGVESDNLSPYLEAGQQGIKSLSTAQPFAPPNPNDVSNTPEYQFQLQQGLQALTRAAAATGGVQGGGALKGITQYGQGLASTAYQQAYNNSLSTYNTNRNSALQLAGLGQFGTGALQSAAQNYGNTASGNILNSGIYTGNIGYNAAQYSGNADINSSQQAGNWAVQAQQNAGNALMQGAGAKAAGIVGQTNAWNSALGGITNAVGGGLNSYYNPYGGGGGVSNSIPDLPNYSNSAYPGMLPPGLPGPSAPYVGPSPG